MTLASLIAAAGAFGSPPPPGWEPPRFEGPVLMCGRTYGLNLVAGEQARLSWVGEMFLNDVFSTFTVRTPAGDVVVTENGRSTRPRERSRAAGLVGGQQIRDHGNGVYSFEVPGRGTVRAVTLRFADQFPVANRPAMLNRLRLVPPAPECGRPVNESAD